MTTSHQLFDWQIDTMKTIRTKASNQALRTKGKRHPCFYDLDPTANYASPWAVPNDLWWRNNGNIDKRYVGNEEMPLIRCIRKANNDFKSLTPADQKKFKFRPDTFPVWAAGAECSVPFLIAAILADNSYNLKGSPVYDYACQVVDNGGVL